MWCLAHSRSLTNICCKNVLLLKSVLCPTFPFSPFSFCLACDHGIFRGDICWSRQNTVGGVGCPTSALQPAHCVILGKSPPLPWSGFLHQQNGYKNLCCSAPYLWCKGQMRTCEELIAKQQKAFCTQAGEEAAAEAIHEALGLHPRGSVFEEGLRENALGKQPSSSLSGKAWCSCSICELKLFLGSITAIMTGPLPEGEGWGVDLSHRWGGQAAQANLRVPMEVRPITPTPQITPGLCLPQIAAPKRAVGRATCSRKD